MRLGDLFQSLSFGVLSNLSIGGEGSGTIPLAHQPRLVALINQGLLALHGRFLLVEKEVIVQAQTSRTLYPLERQHSVSWAQAQGIDLEDDSIFIADSGFDPFLADVLRVVGVADDAGVELPLNNIGAAESLFTPSERVLQIPSPVAGDFYSLLYQARHAPLVAQPGSPVDLDQPVTLAAVLQEALEAFVGSRVLSSMNGQEHVAKGLELAARYDAICAEADRLDLLSTSLVETHHKFTMRGFA